MRYLPTGKKMGEADRHTIDGIGIPSLVLMERAALQCLHVIEARQIDTGNVLIVCGSGNNGGDGFALARLFLEKGVHPTVIFVGKEASRSEECTTQMEIFKTLGGEIFSEIPEKDYTLVVDAIFGVGLSREISGRYATILETMNQLKGIKLAMDIPSGVSAENGQILGIGFRADYTVSMQCEKLGTVLFPGKEYAGEVFAVPIGIDETYFTKQKEVVRTCDRKDLKSVLPRRLMNSHKGTYGKVLLIAGSEGMSGAAFFSAAAAYGIGAGLVKIYTPESNRQVLQQLLPEAIITTYEEESVSSVTEWADVIGIGPGLSKGKKAAEILETVLTQAEVPCVIDADGLNLLAEQNRLELLKTRKQATVLTPHMKEMSRLLGGKPVAEIQTGRFEILKKFVEEYSVTCVLKDARTLVMKQDEHPYLNTTGNQAMAKGGSGDVLTGVITGLLAQRISAYDAAITGVFLHGMAGDQAKKEKGSYGVLARDLIHEIEYCERWQ